MALRWTLALGAVYCYNTSPVFADEPPESRFIVSRSPSFAEADLPTVEAVIEEKRQQLRAPTEEPSRQGHGAAASSTDQTSLELQDSTPGDGSPQALEEEAGQEGAFNPETGEIHWDCPCLGGMAHGPCGEQFKAAFSCFVYSTEEPKGMDCIDKFQTMQDCFRKYPDVYGAELADDDKPPENETTEVRQLAETTEQAASPQQTVESVQEARQPLTTAEHSEFEKAAEPAPTANHHQAQVTPERQTETVSHMPGRWADARDANEDPRKAEDKLASMAAETEA